jgi:hypothetical protein
MTHEDALNSYGIDKPVHDGMKITHGVVLGSEFKIMM